MSATEPASPFRPPPRAEDLPWDDGEPMESDRHVKQMTLLITSLRTEWIDRKDVFIGGNMFVYFSETQARRNDFRGPDVFVVLDALEKEKRLSWVVWEEDGRTPDVVIELMSPGTEAVDRGRKMEIYARQLRVSRYFLFDPLDGRFEGFALDDARRAYLPLAPLEGGNLPVDVLGLGLGVREGTYLGEGGRWLRWLGPDGRAIQTGEERAEAERRRAEDLEARLAAYETRFGPLPG